ncbi:VWA domain-containing protein [Deinococcus aestuarii]|uniref:VWA domain-containing protein n=1 Tax=Deinococcus aestuarii TaxID=2774531 RepID=UPI001C0B1959|nr:VWA domain-containing protein [Deinococcus aestuarii]
MNFNQPGWLLLALLALLLAFLHRQRHAHRAAEVGSLHLWRRLGAEHAPEQARRPRLSAALLLQLLVLGLIALALARPSLGRDPAGGADTLVLLDASRAMRATDVRPDRFTAAAREAAGRLGGRVTVLLVGEHVTPLAVGRADREAVRRSLLASGATDGPADWEAAGRLVRSLRGEGRPRVVAFVAPSTAAPARSALAGLGAEVRTVGGAVTNAALTRFEVIPGRAEAPWTLRGAARLYGPPGERTLTVTLDGQLLARRRLALAPGAEAPFTLTFTPGRGGVLRASLDPDALPADDAVQAVLRPTPAPLRVALIGEAAGDVRRALLALPGAVLSPADTLDADADLVVVTRPGVTGKVSRPTLWLNTPRAAGPPLTPAGWNDRDPLGRGVAWASLTLRSAPARVTPWPDGTALLSAPAGPLVERREAGGVPEVRVNFPVEAGSWVRTPAWPVFLRNVALAARPEAGERVVRPCTVGDPCALPPGQPLTDPAGQAVGITESRFTPSRAGVYRIGGEPLAVNRLAGPEADLTASSRGERAGGTPSPTLPTGRTLRVLLLGLALALLLTEGVLMIRGEPALRRGRWAALRAPQRRMLALHALAAVLLGLALLDVPLPGPGRTRAAALVLPPEEAPPAGVPNTTRVWGTAAPRLTPPPRASSTGDLAAALELAAATLPADAERSVLLMGDRWPASSRLPDVLASLRAEGVAVHALPTAAPPLELRALSLPARVPAGQSFALGASLRAAAPTTLRVHLRRGDDPIFEDTLTVPAGDTRLALPLREDGPGLAGYTLTLRGEGAEVGGQAATRVTAPPRVAVVGGDAGARRLLARALGVQGLDAAPLDPARLRAADLEGYRSLALLDVPARALGPEVRAALTGWVGRGGHLVIGGGPRAFGPGGYPGTALDDLSPLSSRVPRDAPRLALGLLLDKSGSMNEPVAGGVTKLDLIKAAGLAAAGQLHPGGDLAVIAFDTSPKVAVPLGRVGDPARVRSQIARIEAEGGTVVWRALEAGLKQLNASGASTKHLILLTDGIDGGIFNPGDYERLVRRIRATGITVSTVSVGSGMHVPLMRDIARWGEGTFHLTLDWRDVPSLLAQDTLGQGGPAVTAKPTRVRWLGEASGAGPGVVGGYAHTSLRPGATLLARTPGGDPLAASWRVGLGRVTALGSGLAGSWVSAWTARPAYPAQVAALIRAEGGNQEAEALEPDGHDLIVRASSPTVTLEGPGGPRPVALRPDGAGGFVTRLEAPGPGGYSLPDAALGLPAPVSDPALPRRIAGATGGEVLASPARPAPRGGGWAWRPAWPAFALLALLSFLLGLAFRSLPEGRRVRG